MAYIRIEAKREAHAYKKARRNIHRTRAFFGYLPTGSKTR
jgi:hypothetical protein